MDILYHNLDVIHVETNVVNNIIGMLFNIEQNMKDNLNAPLDLKEWIWFQRVMLYQT
jgi:hypothetical protein